jgi:succinate-semialdehyde dehydrogenase/glutarate-semialdehyde dehydrogenase
MHRELEVRNPRTGENDYTIQPPTDTELESVALELRSNQLAWANADIEHRCSVLTAWVEDLLDPIDGLSGELINALAADTGRFLLAMVEVQGIRNIVMGAVAIAPMLVSDAEERDSLTEGVGLLRQRVPYQLAGVISPWNFPLLLSMLDAIPALVAGCAVIVKPSEVTPRFVAPLQDSIGRHPQLNGIFRVIIGDGQTGATLVENVDIIAFTGSVATGRKVAEAAARNFIPALLELGGKDPAIILPSADMDAAAKAVLRASVQATGQACQSLERVYVHRDKIDEFVGALTTRAEQVELNYPDIRQGHIGPLIFSRQAEIILDHLEDAVKNGATILCGGEIETHGGGKWILPTVLTNVNHSMKVMREETFGPLIPVMAYDTIDEVINLANDSGYGLSAAVFGQDIEQAKAVASKINAGAIGINDGAVTVDVHDASHDSFGYSGMGQSRMGLTGMTRFTREKALIVRRNEAQGIESLDERLLSQ